MFLATIWLPVLLLRRVAGKNITIIPILQYNAGVAVDVAHLGGAFTLAAGRMNRAFQGYLNITVTYLTNDVHGDCDAFAARNAEILADFFYKNTTPDTCYAIATTSKS